ncbi:MAG TPA: DNA repair protein RadC [Rugosimonospora sp.]|nr:DNA repair protein RadC [Rugosimonospora sp.]
MRIADLPQSERPRERLSLHGPTALADRELLAVMLGTGGSQGCGAHDLAERLLARFGSVSGLARAHPSDLTGTRGIGSAKASALAAAFELARRAERPARPARLCGTGDIVPVVLPLLAGRTRERLVVVICDNLYRVLACEVVSEGSAERAIVPVREVIVSVLRRDGQAFALAHNHPDGDPTPTSADLTASQRVEEAAEAVGLTFLDHVVIGDGTWCGVTSFPPEKTADR